MHKIHDPYTLLKTPKDPLLEYETYAMIAHLLNPLVSVGKYSTLIDKSKWDSTTILSTLRKNRMLYRLLSLKNARDEEKRGIANTLKNSIIQLQSSAAFYEVYEQKVLELVEKINARGFEIIFTKASEALPLDSHNLDLLVKDRDITSIENLLQRFGFTKVNFYKEPYKTLFRHTRNAEDYLAIHLHTRISWHGLELVDTNETWKRFCCEKIEGVNICFPDKADHIHITIAHMFFECAEITLNDVVTVANDLHKSRVSIENITTLAENAGWKDIFLSSLSTILSLYENIYGSELSAQNDALNKVFNRKGRSQIGNLINEIKTKPKTSFLPLELDSSTKSFRRRRIIKLGLLDRRLSNSRATFTQNIARGLIRSLQIGNKECNPFVVALEGVDGTGKTLHLKRLLDEFNKRGKKSIYVWSRGWLPFDKIARRLLLKIGLQTSTCRTDVTSHEYNPSKGRFFFFEELTRNKVFGFFFAFATIMDHSANLLAKTLSAKRNYDIILLDRYIHDTIVDSFYQYGINPSSLFSTIPLDVGSILTPKPDAALILYSTPRKVEARRSKELRSDEIVDKMARYRLYSKRWQAELIDSGKDIDSVHLKLLETVLRRFYGKSK